MFLQYVSKTWHVFTTNQMYSKYVIVKKFLVFSLMNALLSSPIFFTDLGVCKTLFFAIIE